MVLRVVPAYFFCTNEDTLQGSFCAVSAGPGRAPFSCGLVTIPKECCSNGCPNAYLDYAQWVITIQSVCSAQCGGGTQQFSAECRIVGSPNGGEVDGKVSNTYCYQKFGYLGGNPRGDKATAFLDNWVQDPTSQDFGLLSCNSEPCLSYVPIAAPWSACSAECGGGTRARTLSCRASDDTDVADNLCDFSGVPTEEACNTATCVDHPVGVVTPLKGLQLLTTAVGQEVTVTGGRLYAALNARYRVSSPWSDMATAWTVLPSLAAGQDSVLALDLPSTLPPGEVELELSSQVSVDNTFVASGVVLSSLVDYELLVVCTSSSGQGSASGE